MKGNKRSQRIRLADTIGVTLEGFKREAKCIFKISSTKDFFFFLATGLEKSKKIISFLHHYLGSVNKTRNKNLAFYGTQIKDMVDAAPPVLSAKLRLWQIPYACHKHENGLRKKFKPNITY
jgi:hypothetical protein